MQFSMSIIYLCLTDKWVNHLWRMGWFHTWDVLCSLEPILLSSSEQIKGNMAMFSPANSWETTSTSSQIPYHTIKCCAMENTLIGKNFISLLLQRWPVLHWYWHSVCFLLFSLSVYLVILRYFDLEMLKRLTLTWTFS